MKATVRAIMSRRGIAAIIPAMPRVILVCPLKVRALENSFGHDWNGGCAC
jgi:hypothetical protein